MLCPVQSTLKSFCALKRKSHKKDKHKNIKFIPTVATGLLVIGKKVLLSNSRWQVVQHTWTGKKKIVFAVFSDHCILEFIFMVS